MSYSQSLNKEESSVFSEALLVLLMVCASLLCGLTLYLSCKRWVEVRRMSREVEVGMQERKDAMEMMGVAVIKRIPEAPWSDVCSSSLSSSCCAVCLADFENEESVRLLPCSHVFHSDCLLGWAKKTAFRLKQIPVCPLCREPLSDEGGKKKEVEVEAEERREEGRSSSLSAYEMHQFASIRPVPNRVPIVVG